MQQDFILLLRWYFIFIILGITFLPLTFKIFNHFLDHGYAFSKVTGTIFMSYFVFIFGILKIFQFTFPTILIIFFLFLLVNLKLLDNDFKKTVTKKWKLFLFEEILFFVFLIIWAYIKAHEPNIHGLEKFMDFGFINSNFRAKYLPAQDMWLTPFAINYYYFGHFITALFTKISGIPSQITYNLMLSTIFSYTFILSFSISLSLISKDKLLRIKNLLSSIIMGLIVVLSGNLHTLYSFFSPYKPETPSFFNKLSFLPSSFPNNYWYPNATRFIPFTIHEFPLYSFVVSDLHGHVLDIPFVLFGIALILNFFLSRKITFIKLSLLPIILSIMYMTNAWDAIIYGFLSYIVLVFMNYQNLPKTIAKKKNSFLTLTVRVWKSVLMSIEKGIFIIIFFVLLTLPFSIYFKPFVSGVGVICAPKFLTDIKHLGPLFFEEAHCQRSELWQLLVLYGFFYFFALAFLIFILNKKNRKIISKQDIFVLLLIFTSTVLIVLPEFFYVKDIYPQHYRANTMFKLVYQAFIMLSISSGYIFFRIAKAWKNIYFIFFSLVLISLIFSYPYFSISAYFNNLKIYHGLDGIKYLKLIRPQDFEAIMWINKNIEGQPVILEAQGDSYTDFARISANTGLPTILGWTVHEWLWRGTYDIPAPRIEEVRKAYESKSTTETIQILKKYNVSYVYVGDLEYEKYPNLFEKKFKTLGNVIFQSNKTKIYKLNN